MKWYDVKGFEDYLQVTECGRVRTKPRMLSYKRNLKHENKYYKGVELTPLEDKDGYYRVGFRINLKFQSMYVHRIVALTFIENKDNKPQVNHIDFNKKNNHYTNLEWVTNYENVQHSKKHNRHNTNKIPYELVDEIKEKYKTGNYTHRELAKMYDTAHSNIWWVLHKR